MDAYGILGVLRLNLGKLHSPPLSAAESLFCQCAKLLQFVVLLLLTYNLLSPVLHLTLTAVVNTTWETKHKD